MAAAVGWHEEELALKNRPEALVVMSDFAFDAGFDESRLDRLGELVTLRDPVHATRLDSDAAQRLAEVEVLVTGWGAPMIDADILAAAPRLRIVLHTAGSVKGIVADACFDRGLVVTTAAGANAVPVAEYTLAAILFAGKQVPKSAELFRRERASLSRPDGLKSNYRRTVGVIGFSRIGRRVVELLRLFDVEVLVTDPYADKDQVATAGARLVELHQLLSASDVVSVHAPALPETRHLLTAERLALIRDGGTVINTARGVLIDTRALEAECVSGRLSAVLDVTDPEPLPAGSPLWDLPNVLLTPHVAGAQDTEILRLVDAALDDLERYTNGLRPHNVVTAAELPRTA